MTRKKTVSTFESYMKKYDKSRNKPQKENILWKPRGLIIAMLNYVKVLVPLFIELLIDAKNMYYCSVGKLCMSISLLSEDEIK